MSEPPADHNVKVQWHGERRRNDTHSSTTDPEARLYRKSNNTAAVLCHARHLLMENRSVLTVDAELTIAAGYAARAAAVEMLARLPKWARRRTIAADKANDTQGFVADVRQLGFTPHVAPNTKHSAIDGRTTRHAGHLVSQRIRKRVEVSQRMRTRVEEPFGGPGPSPGRQPLYRGRDRNRAWFKMTAAAYN